jgi:hypothetical protein
MVTRAIGLAATWLLIGTSILSGPEDRTYRGTEHKYQQQDVEESTHGGEDTGFLGGCATSGFARAPERRTPPLVGLGWLAPSARTLAVERAQALSPPPNLHARGAARIRIPRTEIAPRTP